MIIKKNLYLVLIIGLIIGVIAYHENFRKTPERALETQDPSLCGDDGWCYHELATSLDGTYLEREALCDQAKEWKLSCLALIVDDSTTEEDCKSSNNNRECFTILGMYNEDASPCDNLADQDKLYCFIEVASYHENPGEVCEELSDGDSAAFDKCMDLVEASIAASEQQAQDILEQI